MSSIRQNQRGSIRFNWSVQVTIGGITKKFSLGTKDKSQANTMKILIDNMEVQSRINPEVSNQLWVQFYSLIGQSDKYLDKQKKENPFVVDAFKECIDRKYQQGTIGARTKVIYKDCFNNVKECIGKRLSIQDLDQEVYDHFIDFLHSKGYAPVSKNIKLRVFQSFMNWCVERNYIDALPFKVVFAKEPKRQAKFLYPNQFADLIAATENHVMHSYFRFLRATGLRRAEVFQCTEIPTSNGLWLSVIGKGDKERHVQVPSDIVADWEVIKLNPYKVASITRCFKRSCDRIGLKRRLHDLRHTFAFTQIAKGISDWQLQGLMGHSSFKTTKEVYLTMNKEMLVDLAENNTEKLTLDSTMMFS